MDKVLTRVMTSTLVAVLLTTPALAMPPINPSAKLTPAEADAWAQLGLNRVERPVRDIGMRDWRNKPGDVRPLVTGTKQFPVVAIQYTDYASTYTVANFQNMLFGTWASGSARDYYSEVSYGEFNLTGIVDGWHTAANNRAYYGYANGSQRAAMLAKEAAQAADATLNYADYDLDGDGYVDAFTCIHAGYGREETGDGNDIHSHAWSFSSAGIGAYQTNDPRPGYPGQYIFVNDYTIDPERSSYSNNGSMVSIGVFCHEWGHALGLPDLYDVAGTGEGLGNWSLMAAGSWGGNGGSPWWPSHLDAWSKMELGWLNPRAVRMHANYSIPQVETNSSAFWLISRNRTYREYFLIENRRKTSFDQNLPGQGLLVYHIDDSVIDRRIGSNRVNSNNGGWKYGVALEQGDGFDHLYNGNNRGDAGDPYRGSASNTAFDSTTTPDSRTNYPSTPLITGCYARGIPVSANPAACTLSSGVTGAFTGGPDASGWTWIDSDTSGGPTHGWNDISGTGTLLGYGSSNRWQVSLGYQFNFYGQPYSAIWVCTNGWLSFGSDPGTNASSNTAVPAAAAPNAAVYAFWDNLNTVGADSGGIYFQNFGTAPNCSTIVMWKNARVVGAPDHNQVSFQVVLRQSSGAVDIRYEDCAVSDTLYSWGRSATAGVENSTGTVGLQYLYNGSPNGNLLSGARSVRFRPASVFVDVGVTALLAPSGVVDSGTVVTPTCSVYNYSSAQQTYNVRMRIGAGYNQTMAVTNHAPGTGREVMFPNWQADVKGTHAVGCTTLLGGDMNPSNDGAAGTVTVRVADAEVVSIAAPAGTLDTGATVTPRATVRNRGSASATIPVTMRIGSFYTNTQYVTLGAGAQSEVGFTNWLVLQRGTHTVRCSTSLVDDYNPTNDTAGGVVSVRVVDAASVSVSQPAGVIDSGAIVTPRATVRNSGTQAAVIPVTMRIGGGYQNTQSINLGPGAQGELTFANWTAGPRGSLTARCSTGLAGEMNPVNDTASAAVVVRVTDVAATAIVTPSGLVDSGQTVTPQATVTNRGTGQATFTATMSIGVGYSNIQTVTNLAAGSSTNVSFAAWQAVDTGMIPVRCSVALAGDLEPGNDTISGTVGVRVVDVEVVAILAPPAALDSGETVTPRAVVRNSGSGAVSFNTRMIIGSYTDIKAVTNLAMGAVDTVDFAPWTARQRGTFFARCTTMLAGDGDPSNNHADRFGMVRVHDVALSAIQVPGSRVDPGSVTPALAARTLGTQRAPVRFYVHIRSNPPYTDTLDLPAGLPSDDTVVTFRQWQATMGSYAMACSVVLAGDQVPANNRRQRTFAVGATGWVQRGPMPRGPVFATVKDGAFLAHDRASSRVYAAKGNRTGEFYAYDPIGDSWSFLASIPNGREAKPLYAGGTGAADGSGAVYCAKGNRSFGFHRYDAAHRQWYQLTDIPAGPSGRGLKGGGDMACVRRGDSTVVYLLKGYRTEFYKYNAVTDSWRALPDAPTGSSPKWNKGSWLVYDGDRTIYAHKAKYHELWTFNIDTERWSSGPMDGMPFTSPTMLKSKKAKDGSNATWYDGEIYAFKGGNTQEFWRHVVANRSWHELDTLPRGGSSGQFRKVKAGGDIAGAGQGVFFALKGNKTNEFWRYIPWPSGYGDGDGGDGAVVAGPTSAGHSVRVAPNPTAGDRMRLSLELPAPATLDLDVYDVTGRIVLARRLSFGSGTSSISLDIAELPAGVYLIKLTGDGFAAAQKLVVER